MKYTPAGPLGTGENSSSLRCTAEFWPTALKKGPFNVAIIPQTLVMETCRTWSELLTLWLLPCTHYQRWIFLLKQEPRAPALFFFFSCSYIQIRCFVQKYWSGTVTRNTVMRRSMDLMICIGKRQLKWSLKSWKRRQNNELCYIVQI